MPPEMLKERYGAVENIPQSFRDDFRQKSLPMMKWANMLTFNTRAITLYLSCLLDLPWMYVVAEMTLFAGMYIYMRHTHERVCKEYNKELELVCELKIDGLSSFVIKGLLNAQKEKAYLTTTGYNRNMIRFCNT